MAELSTNAREYEKAINFYKEGLTYDETHIPVSVNMLQLDSLVSKTARGETQVEKRTWPCYVTLL